MSFKIERDRTYDNERVVSLLECGTLKVDGEIFPVSDATIIIGNAGYPTIQSAFDSLTGKAVNSATIIIPAPTSGVTVYTETLSVQNINSVVSEFVTMPPSIYPMQNKTNAVVVQGLNLIGDTRYVSGMVYATGVQLNYFNDLAMAPATGYIAKLGTPYGIPTLSNPNPNQIAVTITQFPLFDPENQTGTTPEQPDFVAAGVLPGDHLLIRDDSVNGVYQEVIITQVAGNVITYSGTNVPNLTLGAAVFFCPRVQITTATYNQIATMTVENSQLSMQGIWLRSNVAAPVGSFVTMAALSILYGGIVNSGQCLYDCRGFGGACIDAEDYGEISSNPFNLSFPMHNAAIGGLDDCIFSAYGGRVNGGDWNMFDAGIIGIEVKSSISQAYFASLNLVCNHQSAGINQAAVINANTLLGFYRSKSTTCCAIQRGSAIQVNNDNFQLNNVTTGGLPFGNGLICERGSKLSVGSGSLYGSPTVPCSQIVGCVVGATLQSSADVSFQNSNPLGFTNCTTGIVAQNGSRLNIFSNVLYSGITLAERAFEVGSIYNANASAETPKGVLTYLVSGVMDSTIQNQELDSGGALAITMNPALVVNGITVYEGKTYNLYASSQHAHTLTLPGAFFFGVGAAVGKTVATFNNAVGGEGLSFVVISGTRVQVTSFNGVTFS